MKPSINPAAILPLLYPEDHPDPPEALHVIPTAPRELTPRELTPAEGLLVSGGARPASVDDRALFVGDFD